MDIKKYDIFDVSKLVLSIMIVAIHSGLLPNILYPWLRIAVPIFFIISSFLLFSKIKMSNKDNEKIIVKKYIKRQLFLYAFWFIILLPVTIYLRREWFSDGFAIGIKETIKNSIFSSTFVASWFISATIFGTLIIYFLSKKTKSKSLLIFSLFVYIICCIISSYFPLVEHNLIFKKLYNTYLIIFPTPVFSFPAALIWIMIGKMFAEEKINNSIRNKQCLFVFLLTSMLLLFIEWKFVSKLNNIYSSDCYIFLVPTCTLIFKLLLNINISIKNASIYRKISTIIYTSHGSIVVVLRFILKKVLLNNNSVTFCVFIVTVILCLLICNIIFILENKYKILKYSH